MDPVKVQHQQLQKNISILEDTNSWCKALRIKNSNQFENFKKNLNQDYLGPGVHWKVTHTSANIQLSAAGLLKCVWSFSGHQALKR